VLGNIQLLYTALKENVPCYLVDPGNRIRMVNRPVRIQREEQYGYYLSLIPFSGCVKNLTLRGLKYNVTDYDLPSGIARCVSNEIVEKTASIEFEAGILLIIESKKD